MPDDETRSPSVDCLHGQAIEILGGSNTQSRLGIALLDAFRKPTFEEQCRDTLAMFGGLGTQSKLGQALAGMLCSIQTPSLESQCEDAVHLMGGLHTQSVLGQALAHAFDETPDLQEAPIEVPPPTVTVAQTTPRPRPEMNLTAQWLAKNGRETFAMLVSYLSQRLLVSQRLSLIEDHVQTFLLKLIEKDTLAPHLREGKTVQPSVLRWWVVQSAATELRGWGVDASLRTSRGAKTNRERKVEAGEADPMVAQSEHTMVERRYEIENGQVACDLYDPYARDAEEEAMASQHLEAARVIIRYRIPNAASRYEQVLDCMLAGMKPSEMASYVGVSRHRMAAMISRIREVIRHEVTIGSPAC